MTAPCEPLLTRYANPLRFERLAARVFPWAAGLSGVLLVAGLYFALFASPADYQQGESVRIMYVHVPAAWMALFAYAAMAGAAAAHFIWKHPLADVAAKEAAPLGAGFTAIALVTGAVWGKPMWGAYWVWDARLTSMLILFFLYIGVMAIRRAVADPFRAARVANLLAIVGVVNLPIIKFSVDWWNSLHQPASILRADGPTIDAAMLVPLFLMIGAAMTGFAAMLIASMRNETAARRLARARGAQTGAPSRLRPASGLAPAGRKLEGAP